jgi:ribosomal protein L12E/L44/L45/RPP1/RPP2
VSFEQPVGALLQVVANSKGTELHWPVNEVMSITRACRQTHSESAIMFFGLNEFGGHNGLDDSLSANFIDGINERQRAAVTHMWMGFCHTECIGDWDLPLRRLPGLQHVAIVTSVLTSYDPRCDEERVSKLIYDLAGKTVDVVFENTAGGGLPEEIYEQEEDMDGDDSEEEDDREEGDDSDKEDDDDDEVDMEEYGDVGDTESSESGEEE